MFDLLQAETYWLSLTNIILGGATLACLLSVGWVVVKEVAGRVRERALVASFEDDHSFVLPDLGITMADGGERLDKPADRKNGSHSGKK
jgi:hypothetical protein